MFYPAFVLKATKKFNSQIYSKFAYFPIWRWLASKR